MTTVTQDQALQRWDTLPESLREALYSEASSDFLWKTCAAENLPEIKTRQVAKIAGYVLLGFLHPEDLSRELMELIKIDPRTAKSIQDAINNRIFSPLRADIDKTYIPLSKIEIAHPSIAPKVFQDVSSLPPKPATLPDVGWSKMPAPTMPSPISGIRPPTPPVAKAALKPSIDPAPMMLHEDTTFKAAEKNASFTLSRPGAGADVHMGQGATIPTPPRPAVLEFGGVKPPQSSGAVHYTDLKPSLSAMPTANTGPRSVSQVGTPSIAPMPPSVQKPTPSQSAMPPAPMPPRPSQTPQGDRPIVKDFL